MLPLQLNFASLDKEEAQVHFLQTCINQGMKMELLDLMLAKTCNTSQVAKEHVHLEHQPLTLNKLTNFCYYLKPASRKQVVFEQHLVYVCHLVQSFLAYRGASLPSQDLLLLQEQTAQFCSRMQQTSHNIPESTQALLYILSNYAVNVL